MAKIIGEGEIEEIVRGKKYYIRHHLGKDKKTGKYVRSPRRVVHGNKAEAQAAGAVPQGARARLLRPRQAHRRGVRGHLDVFFVEHGLGHYETVTQFMPNAGREVSRRVYVGYNFHELRHTQATLLIGQGADIKTVQHRLGHSSASLTMDVYAHAIPANDEVAAGIMGDVLGSRDERPQAAPSPSRQPAQEAGITRELIGALLAQLPPEKLVEMLRASG